MEVHSLFNPNPLDNRLDAYNQINYEKKTMSLRSPRKLITFDWAMKRLLRSKANFEILEGFLSELLGEDIFILEILESESKRVLFTTEHVRRRTSCLQPLPGFLAR